MDNLIKFNPNNANSIRNIKIQFSILKQQLNEIFDKYLVAGIKETIQQILNRLQAIENAIDAINQFSYTSVTTLPKPSENTMYKIYLVPSDNANEENIKDEFITISIENNGQIDYDWEQIGSTSINLENYYTKQEIDNMVGNIEILLQTI